jgi:hypothetical protein
LAKGNKECSEGGAEIKDSTGKVPVCNGAAAPTSLPEGDSEHGVWTASFGASTEREQAAAPITFPVPLAGALSETNVDYVTIAEQVGHASSECTGSAEAPTAEAGFLCVYEGEVFENETGRVPEESAIVRPGPDLGSESVGASIYGAVVLMKYKAGSEAKPSQVYGAWAVTAAS